jgi:hypothetical protein
LVWARFEPDAPASGRVHIWADRFGSADHVEGALNSRAEPQNIARGSEPAPELPGGWYLFEQRLPVPGCWRLSGAIDGRVVGSAVIRVVPGAPHFAPIGTFISDAAVGAQPCFGFQNLSYSREFPREVPAWWWQHGASGECSTRSSDLVATRATIARRDDSGYELVLHVSPAGGTQDGLRVTLYPNLGKNAGVVTSAGNASVFFTEVQHVGPSFAPLN